MKKTNPNPKRIETELGIEKLCVHCKDYWPLDDEFWWFQWRIYKGERVKQYCSVCRGCYDEHYRRRRFAVKKKPAPAYVAITTPLPLVTTWRMGVAA